MSRLLIRDDMVQVGEDAGLQPDDQPPKEEPESGVAVRRIAAPLAKLAVHAVGQVMPAGELVTKPDPVPPRLTVRVAVVAVGQMTLAVIFAVTTAPDEDILLGALLFVVTLAQIRALPQASPVAVTRPVAFTVTICGVFDDQAT
jgi:hypothetical protein